MTSRIPNNRVLLAGLIVLAVVTAAIAFVLLGGEDDRDQATSAVDELTDVPLEPWPSDDAEMVRIGVDPVDGPVWQRGDQTLVFTPGAADLSFESWQTESHDDHTEVIGRGTLGDATVRARWTFVDGNPQAHLALEIDGLSSSRLASAMVFTRPALTRPALTRPALPSATAAPTDESGPQEERLVVWQPVAGFECTPSEEAARFNVRIRQIATLTHAPLVSSWRHPTGASAQLVPVFDVPASHADPQIVQTAAKSPQAWLRRARTLIYGHSNLRDPRYGNGGLLGHGLGGTIAVPPEFAEHPDVLELARDLAGSRVEIAPRAEAKDSGLRGTRFISAPSCKTLVELSEKGVAAAVVDTLEPAGEDAPAGELAAGHPPLLATVHPVQLDGQLSSLLAHGFDTARLDEIVRRRESVVFSTPFVATRNPLVGAAKEALIEPERDGQWTVAAELSEAMANLELWREATPLVVTSVSAAASQASASQDVLHWWTADGALQVHNPRAQTIAGFTLVVHGAARAEIEGEAVASRPILLDDTRQATLLWWDLAPGLHTLELSARNDALAAPSAVTWSFDEP